MTTLVDVIPARPAVTARRVAWEKAWWVPLAVILMAQAWLSARIMIGKQAGPDEARYIIAGHQLIYELLHGGGSPYYETYFSGAPDIYSPLAGMADHLGGLAEVRLMDLTFMLAATCLLFSVTRRLFGYWAAVIAMALFAGLGLAHDIGVYGNYDSLALLFLATATYCAVRSQERKWLLLVPLALLAANATKYMTVAFDPVVIGIAALQGARFGTLGWRRIAQRAAVLGLATGALVALILYLAGTAYVKGVAYTTLARDSGNAAFAPVFLSYRAIIAETWHWTGVIMAFGAVAVLVAVWRRCPKEQVALLGLLVFAGCIVTLEAMHLHADESMRQHDTFGAWFTAIACGYGLSRLLKSPKRWLAVLAGLPVLALVVSSWVYSVGYQNHTYEGGGAVSRQFYDVALPYMRPRGGRLLIGYLAFGMSYDAKINVPWWRLYDDIYLKYPIPGRGGDSHGQRRGLACLSVKPHCMYLEGPVAYRDAIHAHWFSFISLYQDHYHSALDQVIIDTAEHTHGYQVLTRLGAAPTWILASAYHHHAAHTLAVHKLAHRATPPVQHGRASAAGIVYAVDALAMPSLIFAFAGIAFVTYVLWRRERLADGTRMPAWAWAYFLAIAGGAAVAACVPNHWERSRRGAGP